MSPCSSHQRLSGFICLPTLNHNESFLFIFNPRGCLALRCIPWENLAWPVGSVWQWSRQAHSGDQNESWGSPDANCQSLRWVFHHLEKGGGSVAFEPNSVYLGGFLCSLGEDSFRDEMNYFLFRDLANVHMPFKGLAAVVPIFLPLLGLLSWAMLGPDFHWSWNEKFHTCWAAVSIKRRGMSDREGIVLTLVEWLLCARLSAYKIHLIFPTDPVERLLLDPFYRWENCVQRPSAVCPRLIQLLTKVVPRFEPTNSKEVAPDYINRVVSVWALESLPGFKSQMAAIGHVTMGTFLSVLG